MGLVYSATFPPTTVTGGTQVDFFEFQVPTGRTLKLLSVHVGQSSEAGDAESEMISYHIKKMSGATSGSGGQTADISAADPSVNSSGLTVEALNTTKASLGTTETVHRDAFHVAAGLHYVPTPDEMHDVKTGDLIVVEMTKAPADNVTFMGTINFSLSGA